MEGLSPRSLFSFCPFLASSCLVAARVPLRRLRQPTATTRHTPTLGADPALKSSVVDGELACSTGRPRGAHLRVGCRQRHPADHFRPRLANATHLFESSYVAMVRRQVSSLRCYPVFVRACYVVAGRLNTGYVQSTIVDGCWCKRGARVIQTAPESPASNHG